MAAANEYGLAVGSGVALAALDGIENYLAQFNRQALTSVRRGVAIRSQPVDEFPIREQSLSGRERGDGSITHLWEMVMATYAVKALLDRYLSGGTVVSAAVTLNTRMHMTASFKRYNAFIVLPKPREDIEYLRQGIFRVTLRFTHLETL